MSLVDDEVVRCGRFDFRLQVWRGKELQPVVLMLGIDGQPPPDFYTCRLAHIAMRFVSAPPIPLFFQYSLLQGKPRAFKVTLQVDGTHLRPWLHEPKYGKVDPSLIERLFCIKGPQTQDKVNPRSEKKELRFGDPEHRSANLAAAAGPFLAKEGWRFEHPEDASSNEEQEPDPQD